MSRWSRRPPPGAPTSTLPEPQPHPLSSPSGSTPGKWWSPSAGGTRSPGADAPRPSRLCPATLAALPKAFQGIDNCETHPMFEAFGIVPDVRLVFDNYEVAIEQPGGLGRVGAHALLDRARQSRPDRVAYPKGLARARLCRGDLAEVPARVQGACSDCSPTFARVSDACRLRPPVVGRLLAALGSTGVPDRRRSRRYR